MSCLIVIPARYASSRYPGKPLVEISGASGEKKTLIQRSWEAAQSANVKARVVVATDDRRIGDTATGFGAEVVMTSESCTNGTERCAEVLSILGETFDCIVNLQGDAPLTPPWFVDNLVDGLLADADFGMATPVLRCDGATLSKLKEDRSAGRVGGTTAVMSAAHQALYFSKEVLPYTSNNFAENAATPVFHHVGVYAYRTDALKRYMHWPIGPLEQLEGLEQLRFLENGAAIKCVEVEAPGRVFWELNNPSDLPKIEEALLQIGLE